MVILFSCLILASVPAQEQKGDLWVLAVGINKYPDNQYFRSLSFCVRDAKNICDLFKTQEGKAFNKVNTPLIADTEAIKPTRSNIFSQMAFLKNAKQNDTVILYFALHGTLQDGSLYLLPSDVRQEAAEKIVVSSGINFNDIVQNFNMPGKKIIMLDTHYSETAIKAVAGKNIAVLGACKDDELARESFAYGGYFTFGVVEAFKKSADGKITIGSLYGYIKENVGRISSGKQNPVLYVPPEMGDPVLGAQ
jgi:uncharacterized caspase-like protein